jgi:hypothetical protein
MTAQGVIRWSTVAVVSAVAAIAGWVSYDHALAVVRAHGETGAVARAYPLTIDGLIYAASMVLLNAARRGLDRPRLAYVALGLGVSATLSANIAAGLAYGPVGAIVAAWPAPALVISYELLMLVIRTSVARAAPAVEPAVPASPWATSEASGWASPRATAEPAGPAAPRARARATRRAITKTRAARLEAAARAGHRGRQRWPASPVSQGAGPGSPHRPGQGRKGAPGRARRVERTRRHRHRLAAH